MENTIIIRSMTREEKDELLTEIREVVTQVIKSELKTELPKKHLTKKETASVLRISQPTLTRLTKSGKVKGNRIGRRILYNADDVQNALQRIGTLKYLRS